MTRSHRGRLSRLARLVNVLGLAACVDAPRPSPGAPLAQGDLAGPFAGLEPASFVLPPHRGYADARVAGRVGELAARGRLPNPPPETRYVLDDLTSPVLDARFDDTLGDAMADALDAAEDEGRPVDRYGTGALDYEELMGDDVHAGACEIPRILASAEHDGEDWELSLGVAMIETFVGELSPAMGDLHDDCVADLLAVAGDVDAAGECLATDEAMFFPEGSDCRACLGESAGDYAACVELGRCAEEAPVLESRSGTLWSRLEATILSCAPDHTIPGYVLAELDDDGSVPEPFDDHRWAFICAPFWSDSLEEVTTVCQGGADTVRVGVTGLVEGMRRDGDPTPWYRHRPFYTPRVALEGGTELRYAWEAYSSGGVISAPVVPDDSNGDGVVDAGDDYYGYQYGSWGLDPLQLRPDGDDAAALDDTFARDWFGAIAVKTATTRDGISILMANHTRCAEWDDLDGDGSFRCTRTEDPEEGWLGDLPHFRWDPDAGTTYPMPVVTLGSTGLPDPDIPGGIVAHVASTPTLGDPDWDDCAWDDTFVPDRAWIPDTPLDYTSAGSTAADTWRFGGHDELDLRILLYTNLRRDFCPDGVAP